MPLQICCLPGVEVDCASMDVLIRLPLKMSVVLSSEPRAVDPLPVSKTDSDNLLLTTSPFSSKLFRCEPFTNVVLASRSWPNCKRVPSQ